MEISADGGKAEAKAADWAAACTARTCAGGVDVAASGIVRMQRRAAGACCGWSSGRFFGVECNAEQRDRIAESYHLMDPWFRFEPGALWGPPCK